MASSGSKSNEGHNIHYTRRNEGSSSIPLGPGYGALFSPIPGMRYPEQTSTHIVHHLEQPKYGIGYRELDLNLGLNMQTPAQITHKTHRRSRQRSKQWITIRDALPNQVVVF